MLKQNIADSADRVGANDPCLRRTSRTVCADLADGTHGSARALAIVAFGEWTLGSGDRSRGTGI